MRLFSPDLFRNFGIGFAFGAVMLAVGNAGTWGGELAPAAQAAESHEAPVPAGDFLIAPEGR
ncbi:hypothetical protein [Erythrobacter sp. R86502]|uniref:hypothetical protein n=1 Tax=Erythrobacter sp. R86502 TaxID=3093846 RepID=UPI0036D3C1BE